MLELAHKTHLVLDSMGVDHWLMYGSLWGPLRGIPGPLPWDDDVDIGMDGNGDFKKIPLKEFKAKFEAAGLVLIDKLQESGYLSVKGYGESIGLFLYYNYRGTMMRSGYESWLFYIHYRFRHSFPAKLLQHPLPKVKFGSFNISVPRGGMEIMKHLYPTDWWKTLYHYTDEAGAAGIKKSKVIKGSTDKTPIQNRRHGCGVYFTSIDPSNDPKTILLNNYDDRGFVINSQRLWAKIDWVIEVKMQMNNIEKVYDSNRDVYLYKGDVHLNNYQHSIYKNPKT
ncbi:unnamed protein product [Porites evermanni]|uniref:Tox-ART-HYD1 domain-containing protein n=1 Tax=Porites evermanni TaxID=104178 RepID=A0ABN8QN46_9CNID|nr:unnamed protein product [Porites evermanni]